MKHRPRRSPHRLRRLRIHRIPRKNHRIRPQSIRNPHQRTRIPRIIRTHRHSHQPGTTTQRLPHSPQHRTAHRKNPRRRRSIRQRPGRPRSNRGTNTCIWPAATTISANRFAASAVINTSVAEPVATAASTELEPSTMNLPSFLLTAVRCSFAALTMRGVRSVNASVKSRLLIHLMVAGSKNSTTPLLGSGGVRMF